MSRPELSTVVVSWSSADDVRALMARFPSDPRHELVVVDNGDGLEPLAAAGPNLRLVRAGGNLGFAGGANLGARESRGAALLFLNPDTTAEPGAFDAVLAGLAEYPDAAGVVPALVDERGRSQHRWQLRRLPSAGQLALHALFWDRIAGAASEPPAGAVIEQPAAAALALRRPVFERMGGFDARFHPAWFEDVDLAKRLGAARERLLYWPPARFRHRGGASIAALGYGRFLLAYERNLALYLALHHGRGWAALFRALVPLGAGLRIALLPLRRPRRARSRGEAASALAATARAAVAGFPAAGGGRS